MIAAIAHADARGNRFLPIYVPRFRTSWTASAKLQRTCDNQRRILAQAVPGHKIRLQTLLRKQRDERPRNRSKFAGCVLAVSLSSSSEPAKQIF